MRNRLGLVLVGLLVLGYFAVRACSGGAPQGLADPVGEEPVPTPAASDESAAPSAAPPAEPERSTAAAPTDTPLDEAAAVPDVEPPSPPPPAAPVELCSVALVVRDAVTGAPVEGLRIELLKRLGKTEPFFVRTDAEGRASAEVPCGEYLVLNRPDAGLPAAALTPSDFELVPPDEGDAPAEELEFLTHRADDRLAVEVVDVDGRPVQGAWATLSTDTMEPYLVDTRARTDAEGRAELAVWKPEAYEEAHVRAWDEAGRVSELLAVEAPFVPGLRRLVLRPSASVEVLVHDAAGAPQVGARVLTYLTGVTNPPRRYQLTGADGTAVIEGLHLGERQLETVNTLTRQSDRRTFVAREGQRERVVVRFPDESDRVAVHGRVTTPEGEPLVGVRLVIEPGDHEPMTVRTGDDGRYQCLSDPCETVTVRANAWSEGPVLEPDAMTVPFGGEASFRRTLAPLKRRFDVEVVDRVTGEELREFVATIDRGPGSEKWSNSYAPRRTFELLVVPESRWRVAVVGYLVAELALFDVLAKLRPGERLRIELEPGFAHEMQVFDADNETPLAGVRFVSETAEDVVTDEEGWARFEADHWPTYRVEHPGFEPEPWDPRDHVRWDFGPLYLQRAR